MTTTTPDVLKLLREGRERIARGWTQDTFARDACRRSVAAWSDDAVCWCVRGAVFDSPWATDALGRSLSPSVGYGIDSLRLIRVWNDAPERTQADVLALFDKVIAAEENRS